MNIEKNIQQLFEERQDIPLFYPNSRKTSGFSPRI